MAIWRDIPGWCDYEDLYRSQVDRLSTGYFVEVGAWVGRSACLMGTLIRDSHKPIAFDTIESGRGDPGVADDLKRLREAGATIELALRLNVAACGLDEYVKVVIDDSVAAARTYADQSLDFVFLDAAHEEEPVRQDVRAWLPKVRPGGVLAGHDWSYVIVQKSVLEIIRPHEVGTCWLYIVGGR
jgi:predicted O-methyltransferase YrrM